MDQDTTSNDHAMFRGYSNMAGRWMSPDPYDGSYDSTNPQSFNRYAYVLNNPGGFLDPLGLNCVKDSNTVKYSDDGGQTWQIWSDTSSTACDSGSFQMASMGGAAPVSPFGGAIPGVGGGISGTQHGSIKSPARQECEAQAQQQFDATRARLNRGFLKQLASSAGEGLVGGAITGCFFTSEIGCGEGVLPGAILGALTGASISTYHYIWDNGPQMMSARQQYYEQMQACMSK